MNVKLAVIGIAVLCVVSALAALTFVSTAPASVITYIAPASAVHASLGQTTSDGTIALRLNEVTDGSNPATSNTWIALSREAHDAPNMPVLLYCCSLNPSLGESNLVANVTVMNVHNATAPFSFGDFVLVSQDGAAYYPNYVVCGSSCTAQVAAKALNATFASNLYVLFSVPEAMHPAKLVWTASEPDIVISLT
jgi:hypothetical protein